ncbi:MAG: tetratricopeptide repeat protein [Pirellulaceae bacterium]
MVAAKNVYRFAFMTLMISVGGCQSGSGGFSMNPFASRDSSTADQIVVEDVTPTQTQQQATGFTDRMRSAGVRTRDAIAGVFTFGRSQEQATEVNATTDALSLSNTPDKLGPEVYVANGQLWESSGAFERAMENYSKALDSDPKNGAALSAIARLHDRQNRLDESLKFFNRAIEVMPNDSTLYNDSGLVMARQENYEAAIDQIQKAIAIEPGNKRFANNLATVYMDSGSPEKAMQTLNKAHEPAVAHYNMAFLNFKRQQSGEARNQLQQALAIDPTLEPARNLLDKLGGTQIAQATKETITAASNIGQEVQNVSQAVQNTYQSFVGETNPSSATISTSLSDQETNDSSDAVTTPAPQPTQPTGPTKAETTPATSAPTTTEASAPPTVDPIHSAPSISHEAHIHNATGNADTAGNGRSTIRTDEPGTSGRWRLVTAAFLQQLISTIAHAFEHKHLSISLSV